MVKQTMDTGSRLSGRDRPRKRHSAGMTAPRSRHAGSALFSAIRHPFICVEETGIGVRGRPDPAYSQ